jgi:hypothetical protein
MQNTLKMSTTGEEPVLRISEKKAAHQPAALKQHHALSAAAGEGAEKQQ